MKTITLPNDVWLRGSPPGGPDSCLLTHEGDGDARQCCLGIAASALGVDDHHLFDVATIRELVETVEEFGKLYDTKPSVEDVERLKAVFLNCGHSIGRQSFVNDHLDDLVYNANDIRGISDEARVALINSYTERVGLRFVLEAQP
jgi:hypothetical protein